MNCGKSCSRRTFLNTLGGGTAGSLAASTLGGCTSTTPDNKTETPPNFIVMFADDMGYGDWNRGGHPTIRTPNLNRMADEGVQMTQFYSGEPLCSPSRSALLTGRTTIRTGVVQVFFPGNSHGMSPDEITIADALKPLGYATACIGKWHLGDAYEYRPLRQGFDYYYGILYSNDMDNPDIWRNDEVIEHPTDQTTLTRRYTEEAVSFIERSKNSPFFLYLPYTFPHVPLFASDDFLGTSFRGLYGDVIEEIDWSVGRILDTVSRLGLDENTFIIFTSDNGPWAKQKIEGGSAGLLRGAKGETWEGGMREPTVFRWKGRLPAGTVNMQVGQVIDLFPTLVTLAGGTLPDDRPIDGIDLMPVLEGRASPERTIYYYRGTGLNAIRHGRWKAHFRYTIADPETGNRRGFRPDTPLLFDLEADPSEQYDVAADHPGIVQELTTLAEGYTSEVKARGENRELLDWFADGWVDEIP